MSTENKSVHEHNKEENIKEYYNSKTTDHPLEALDYMIDSKPIEMSLYKEWFIDTTIALLKLEPHHRVLDAGCGNGLILQEVEKLVKHSEGFDISEKLVSMFNGKSKVQAASITEIDFKELKFDRIYMISVGIHFPDMDYFKMAVRKLFGLLDKNGVLLIGDQVIADFHNSKKYLSVDMRELVDFLLEFKCHFSILTQDGEKRKRNRYDILLYK